MLALVPKYTVAQVLEHRWWIALVAMGISLVLTPIFRLIAYRAKIVDRPDDLLKPHGRPVAYLGGLGICAGLLGGLACHFLTIPDLGGQWRQIGWAIQTAQVRALWENPVWRLLGAAAACLAVTIVGLLDDIYDISPRKKLLGQGLAASILLVGGIGYRTAPIFLPAWAQVPWLTIPLSVAIVLLLVTAACNAMNLLDGLDGLCGGVTGIISLGFLGLAIWLAVWSRPENYWTEELRISLALAMAGAVIGFLPYNIPPASIFMGDAGSMLLGFFVATSMALFCREGNLRWLLAACVVFALPILDTSLAVVRRLLMGRSIFAGDRSHLYDQLVDRGMTVRQVVVLFYILATIASVAGVLLAIFVRIRYMVPICLGALAIIWTFFFMMGMVTPPSRRPSATPVRQEQK